MLVSEVVTNAPRHTRGPLRLNLSVRDTDRACPVRYAADLEAEGGRRTELLDLPAGAWGTTCMPTGKTTWFEIPIATAGSVTDRISGT
ncbi:hypothetical protein ACWD4F_27675 [Streptomyces aureus]